MEILSFVVERKNIVGNRFVFNDLDFTAPKNMQLWYNALLLEKINWTKPGKGSKKTNEQKTGQSKKH